MSNKLPKQELPEYEHILTGINQKVKYRPFTNKEQKILLLAKDSEDSKQIITAMQQVVENCLITKPKKKLPIFDFEDIFLRIRSKSVSEEAEMHYRYKETGEEFSIKVNLDDVRVVYPDVSNIIKLSDDMAIVMRYPSVDSFKLSEDEFLFDCIESVCKGEEIYSFEEYSKEEKEEWVDSLDSSTVIKINEFLQNIPALEHTEEVELKDKRKIKIKLKGLNDFFI